MNNPQNTFDSDGYVIVENLLSDLQVAELQSELEALSIQSAGTRNILEMKWCQGIVDASVCHPEICDLLPQDPVAIQCIYFEKSEPRNWLVPLHRDSMFPIDKKIDNQRWDSLSEKEGKQYGRPSNEILDKLVAVRIHLEANDAENGPLQVVPGSHKTDQDDGERVTCFVPQGGALVLRPQLLHASSKVRKGIRRVLHLVFGPAFLPDGDKWAYIRHPSNKVSIP